jgi:hypothetical protein|tara:strand:+ start:180 stop:494 length:315 start_codon:yes stop_codon:yes gene_type:complete
MANYQYCVATNWGKGFITHSDSSKLDFTSFPGNVWKVNANNQDANRWVSGVAGVRKTLSEAQAIVNAEITAAQAEWDSIPDDDERKDTSSALYIPRPEDITLEE